MERATTIQAISGLVFSGFTTLHVGGHLLSYYSFDLADTALLVNRELFWNPIVEGVILGSFGVHMAANGYMIYKRSLISSTYKTGFSISNLTNHRISGYILNALVPIHIIGARLLPLLRLNDPSVVDLTIVTHALKSFYGMPLYFTLLGSAGIYHTILGIDTALVNLRLKQKKLSKGYSNYVLWSTIPIVMGLVAILGGAFEEIDIPMAKVFQSIND